MRRRQFTGLSGMLAAILAWPAFAQGNLPVVAVFIPGLAAQTSDRIDALRAGLRDGGLVEGTHYTFALRFGDGVAARWQGLIMELGALKPSVIVSAGVGNVVKRLLPDTPQVFTAIAVDPIKLGMVDSFAHPGGNVTGNVLNPGGDDHSMTQKRIELFRQLVPSLKRLGFLGTKKNMLVEEEIDALRSMAGRLGLEIVHHELQTVEDIDASIAASVQDGVDAFYVSGEPLLIGNVARTVEAIAASGKPAFGTLPDWGRAGLLMSYSADVPDGFRRAGIYAARIVRGEKPGDLPIEQPSKFTLVVNARTAKRLGITLPATFLADEVID